MGPAIADMAPETQDMKADRLAANAKAGWGGIKPDPIATAANDSTNTIFATCCAFGCVSALSSACGGCFQLCIEPCVDACGTCCAPCTETCCKACCE